MTVVIVVIAVVADVPIHLQRGQGHQHIDRHRAHRHLVAGLPDSAVGRAVGVTLEEGWA
jgi:hypothetical protein